MKTTVKQKATKHKDIYWRDSISESKERSECEVVKLETTESKWEVELDVTKFKPEDLKVSRFIHITHCIY